MEVAEVNLREESQLENLHDHLQSDKEQGKEQEPQENRQRAYRAKPTSTAFRT